MTKEQSGDPYRWEQAPADPEDPADSAKGKRAERGVHARVEPKGFKLGGVEIALVVFALLIGIAFIALQLPAQLASIGDPSVSTGAESASSTEQGGGGSNVVASPIPDHLVPSYQGSTSGAAGTPELEQLRSALNLTEDYRPGFVHGEKPVEFQKWIVLHDTESESPPEGVVDYWDGNGEFIAAHFVVGTDGAIVQCVPLDKIAHHAGFGDAGHNALFGVEDESRDDKVGTEPIGDWAPDYGMNSYSVGIEMVHVGGSGYYPEEQLEAVDALIAYIDAYFGMESQITDHKAWRSGNSDTSPEFADYLANYQDHRTHTSAT